MGGYVKLNEFDLKMIEGIKKARKEEKEKYDKEREKLKLEREKMNKERESDRMKIKADQANAILDNMLRNPKMKDFSNMELSGIVGTTAEYVASRRAMISPE